MTHPTASGFFDNITISQAAMTFYREGRQASKQHDHRRAIALYAEAYAFPDTPPLFRARLLEYRGESYWLLCVFAEAERDYQMALELCDEPEQKARVRVRLSEMANFLGDYGRSLKLCQQALEESKTANNVLVTAWAQRGLAIVLRQQGNTEQALSYLTQALAAFRTMGEVREQARILTGIARTHLMRGEYQRAMTALQEALHLFRSLDDRWRVTQTLNDLGECYQGLYDLETALALHERALAQAQEQQARIFLPKIYRDLGIVLVDLGQIDSGMVYLGRSLEEARGLQAREQALLSLYQLVRACLFSTHQPELAERYVAMLKGVAGDLEAPRFCALAAFAEGELLFWRGERQTAVSCLEKALLWAQTAVDRGILWQIHAAMSRMADNPDIANVHRNIAAEFLRQTVEPLQDPQLKKRFLHAPPVAEILRAANIDPNSL